MPPDAVALPPAVSSVEQAGGIVLAQASKTAPPQPSQFVQVPSFKVNHTDDDDDEDGILAEAISSLPKIVLLGGSVVALVAGWHLSGLKVPMEEMQKWASSAPKVAQAIPFSVALYVIADYAADLVFKFSKRSGVDLTIASFLQGVIKYSISLIAFVSLLGTMGVQTNSLTAAVTSMGLAVGLASQKVLTNLAAGLMLLILRPFKAGDFVTLGGKTTGVIHQVSLFATQLDTYNNIRISVPNSDVYGSTVENFSKHRMRLVEVEFTTAASGNLEKTRKVLAEIAGRYRRHQDEEMTLRRMLRKQNMQAKAKQTAAAAARTPAPPGSGTGQTPTGSAPGSGAVSPDGRLSPRADATPTGGKDGKPGQAAGTFNSTATKIMDDVKVLLDWQKKGLYIDFSDMGLDPHGKVAPKVYLKQMTPQGYLWLVRIWVPTPVSEVVKFEMTEEIALALKRESIRTSADVLELKYLPKRELPAGAEG